MEMRRHKTGWFWHKMYALILCVLLFAPGLHAQDAAARVEQVLSSPQRYSGSMIDDLAQLGRPAIPALAQQLDTYRFPLVILQALRRIGDASATLPVAAYLNRISADPDRQEERLVAITLLRELGDTRAESTLQLFFADENAPLATRVAAASALAKWGAPGAKEEAVALILKVAREHPPGTRAFRHDVLDEALASIDSDRGRSLLIERLDRASSASEQGRIIHLLGRDQAPAAASALVSFVEDKNKGADLRMDAAKVLLDSGMDFPRDRVLVAMQQIRDLLPPDLRPQAEELCRRLRP
jgi:HEAT repeat protein